MTKRKGAATMADKSYFALVRRFPLKPISSDKELDQATTIINELIDRGFDDLTSGEEAYLDVLSDLAKKYESVHHPIPDAGPIDVLQFLMDDRKLNQRAVALGSGIAVSTVSEIMAGRRHLNFDHMQKLAHFFAVPVSVFLPKETARTEKKMAKR